MNKTLGIILTFALMAGADELTTRTQVMMGTFASVSLPKNKAALANKVFERLKKVEMALSSYAPQAQIYRLNHEQFVNISQDTFEALTASKRYYKETQGYFDITVGSITKGLFHFGEDERVPSEDELKEARVNFNGLFFDKRKAWIDKGIIIDLGGMGKGFGVDKAVALMQEEGVKEGIVSLSGDIRCLHRCEISIENPFYEGILASFIVGQSDTGISTSGNYRRYVKNRENNHLINPKEHRSEALFASITLISDTLSNSDLDAYATAASVMPMARAFTFLKRLDDVGYLIVTNDRKLYKNELFDDLTKSLKLFPLSQAPNKE